MEHPTNYRNKRKRYFLPRHFLVTIPIIVAVSAGYIQRTIAANGLLEISNHSGINGAFTAIISMFVAVFLGMVLYFFLTVYYNHKHRKKGDDAIK
jgi:hypothetical protein